MSPLIGIFVITLLSSILYNKFDENSQTATTRKNPHYSFEKSHAKSKEKKVSKDRKGSEFLNENQDSLVFENISEMDVCIFTIVAGNQIFCKEKTDENLNRLTLLMMSCHAASEDKIFPKCAKEKKSSECISGLGATDLEIFKNVKKRAFTVCQEVSQQLFMINSQKRAQALLETAQLHSSVMTSFKDNQKLLENITTRTLTRLRAQRVAYMKDMRLFKKYFTKNESVLIEAARSHFTLLSRHKKIIGGLEKDVNILTEGFLQTLEAMQDNFTAFSVKIFEKHGEIMANLNRVENTADKILKQLEMIEEHDYTVALKNAFNWIMANLWRSRHVICVVLSSIICSLMVRRKIFSWLKFVLMASFIGGVFLQYEYVGLLIAALFMSILAEVFLRCFSYLIQPAEVEMNSSIENGSVHGIQDNKIGETSGENGTFNDSLEVNSDDVKFTMSSTDTDSENSDNIGSDTTSVMGASGQCVNITSANVTENQNNQNAGTRGDNMVLQGTMVGFEAPNVVTGRCGVSMDNMVQNSAHLWGKCVQTTTSCDNEVQTGPGNDMAVQTSTKCDSEAQTGASENVSVQTNARNESSAQTNKVVKVQTNTRTVHAGTNSAFTVVRESIQIDNSLQTGTSKDITRQPGPSKDLIGQCGKTYDFGVPHEPLGIQDEITSSTPRQSGIIVNIGDNFSNPRGMTPSPVRQSRTSSPFEVVPGDIRRSSNTSGDMGNSTVMSGLRQVSQDLSGETGTVGDLSSIQVGVQINRSGSEGQKRECGLMTLQGTPCRRRVSAGRCYIHSKQ